MTGRTFADWAIAFNDGLRRLRYGKSGGGGRRAALRVTLPDDYHLMNPFADGPALAISQDFYRRFYSDSKQRRIIFGINPGRHGAGLTGVPFTDSRQLASLDIDARGIRSYEPSASFIYRMIERFGGPASFYRRYYINSPLPLGIVRRNSKGNHVNANYYDSAALQQSVAPLVDHAMACYGRMPIGRTIAFCLGQGKNYRYLQAWNKRRPMFEEIIPLAHPRYIVQYRSRQEEHYIADYLEKLLR